MSLRDYVQRPGRLTTHELINLITHLPPGCALDRAMRGEAADWSLTDHLLARLNNITHQAHAGKRVPDSQLIRPPDGKKALPKPVEKQPAKGWDDLNALYDGG